VKKLLWIFLTAPMFLGPPSGFASEPQVLLFAETSGASPYQAALENRGYPYALYAVESSFNQAIDGADPAYNVVVVDSAVNPHDFTSVEAFAQAGGRALLQHWNLTAGSSLAAAFQVTVAGQVGAPLPLYNWSGSTFFAGLTNPLLMEQIAFNTNGQKLQPTAGGQAVAGYTTAQTANQAALVLGHSGRTIVNGFVVENADPIEDGVKLVQHELDFLVGPSPQAAPLVTVQPRSQMVLAGTSAILRVSASGSLPISYQWCQDTASLPGATNNTYSLTGVQPGQAGAYTVVLTKLSGSVTSNPALLAVTNSNPVSTILLFVDGSLSSPYASALANLGLANEYFTALTDFNAALGDANPADTLAIVDSTWWLHSFGAVTTFVRAGGRSLLQYYNLSPGTSLPAAFNTSVAQVNYSALPVHDWGGSDLFAGVSSPLVFTEVFTIDGQKLQPTAGGQAAAGFSSSPAANQAAIIIGNSGRTIVNAFVPEKASFSGDAVQLAQNEIQFLLSVPPFIQSLSLSGTDLTLTWSAVPGRNYWLQYKGDLNTATWTDLAPAVLATGPTAKATDTNGAAPRFYRVRLVP